MNLPHEKQQGDRWRSIMEIFDRAAEMPPDERKAFLESGECAPDVRQEVIELLQKLETRTDSRVLPRPAVPNRLGRYLVLEPLGRGGMGEVFVAQDTELDRRVALKFLTAEMFGGRSGIEILTREAKTLSSLNHPNIVTIHEVIQSGSAFAIVMELVEGTALRSKLGAPVAEGQLAQIGQQIARALAAAHSAGIIHRDIKPENIILRTDGYVKVLDFGLARRINSEAQSSSIGLAAGTVRYMSPEQTRGATLTSSTDVFSLGLVLYELATGSHPFAGSSLFETAHAIAANTPKPPSSLNSAISPSLNNLILSMLAKDPGARPSAGDIALLLGDTGTGTLSRMERNGKVLRRRFVGSVAVASLAAAGGVYWWRSRLGTNSPVQVLLDNGEVRDPVFSPDGSRIAFSWKPPGAERFHLALITTRGGEPSLLAAGGTLSMGPAWSPDGKRICFARQGFGENGLYVKALQDGTERRVMTLTASTLGDRVDWIPRGTTVVVADTSHGVPLTLLDLETGARRDLPTEPTSSDISPKCSPDGEWIAFSRYFTHTTADLFVMATSGGAARRLTFDGSAKRGHRWTPDGRGILFKARFGNRWGLWHVPAAGGTVSEVALPQFAAGAFDLRAGPDGGLVVASADQFQVASISRMEIPAEGQGLSRPMRMIAAGERGENLEANPSISPDGLRIAFVSLRSGCPEIWLSDSAGETAKQITSFGGPEITQPAWSPDGRYLLSASAPDGRRNLFLVDVESGHMRWLTTSGLEETEPQWSRDGRWITFASSRSGRQELWRMPAPGGAAHRLTQDGGVVHRESPDGRWVYFVYHERSGLWRMPWQGGKAELVLDRVYSELYRAWAIGRRGVYYTYKDSSAANWTVALYDPESRTERALAVFDHPLPRWSGTLTLSPDERWMLLPIIEAFGSRLVLFSGVKV